MFIEVAQIPNSTGTSAVSTPRQMRRYVGIVKYVIIITRNGLHGTGSYPQS